MYLFDMYGLYFVSNYGKESSIMLVLTKTETKNVLKFWKKNLDWGKI